MQITKFTDKNYNGNMYIIESESNFLIVDPCVNFLEVKNKLDQKTCVGIFLTHAHFDHFCEIESYFEIAPKIFLKEEALEKLADPTQNASIMLGKETSLILPQGKICFVNENNEILIGNKKGKVLYLPGHTNCLVGLVIENHFFCGDFIFQHGNIGRYDLPTGSGQKMRESLRKLKTFPKELVVHSGHGNDFVLEDWHK